jgi:hypothetical protein
MLYCAVLSYAVLCYALYYLCCAILLPLLLLLLLLHLPLLRFLLTLFFVPSPPVLLLLLLLLLVYKDTQSTLITADATAGRVESALESVRGIGDVSVTLEAAGGGSSYSTRWTVTFSTTWTA